MPVFTRNDLEHERDIRRAEPRLSDLPATKQIALVKLVACCEGLTGCLGDLNETHLRERLAEVRSAFGIFDDDGRSAF